MELPWLPPGGDFPDTHSALEEPAGLLAAGNDLSVDTLLRAYQRGIFPWYSEGEPLLWWSPAPRTVLWPDQLHVSRRLAKTCRQPRWQITSNQQFSSIIHACATTPRDGQHGTWITPDMQAAYIRLHEAGFARSIEVSVNGELVGGLYGVHIGQMFFGESMFCHVSNASKVALLALCRRPDVHLIDCQMATAHLLSLGATSMNRPQFEAAIKHAMEKEADYAG